MKELTQHKLKCGATVTVRDLERHLVSHKKHLSPASLYRWVYRAVREGMTWDELKTDALEARRGGHGKGRSDCTRTFRIDGEGYTVRDLRDRFYARRRVEIPYATMRARAVVAEEKGRDMLWILRPWNRQ